MIDDDPRSGEGAAQSTLLPRAEMLDWLPDETLFSLVSRYHVWSGQPLAKATSRALFGNSNQGYQHDFPSNIGEFVRRTGGLLGTPREIVKAHTVLPYYLPFRPSVAAADAYQSLCDGGLGSLKYRLGILTSRFRANHPLKACPACMRTDRAQYGIAYWHVTHQLPGVWMCLRHGQALLASTTKSTGVGRFLWRLPAEDELVSATQSPGPLTAAQLDHLEKLARLVQSLWELPQGFHFDVPALTASYNRRLFQNGLVTSGGSLRTREIGKQLAEVAGPLKVIEELAPLCGTPAASASQAGRLLRSPGTGTHPLRHLMVVLWLFGDWDSFIQEYRIQQSMPADVPTGLTSAGDRRSLREAGIYARRAEALALLRASQLSIAQVACRVSADHATVSGWATAAGVGREACQGAPRKSDGGLVDDLRQGEDKAVVARRYGVSIPTVNRTLRREPGLRQAWSDARLDRLRNLHRTEWQALLDTYGGAGAKLARSHKPALFAWLYRNDRAWLVEIMKARTSSRRGNNVSIDWDRRDVDLAADVQRVAAEIYQQHPGSRIALWQIYQRLPALKAKLSALERLPLTRRAIDIAIGFSGKSQSHAPLFP